MQEIDFYCRKCKNSLHLTYRYRLLGLQDRAPSSVRNCEIEDGGRIDNFRKEIKMELISFGNLFVINGKKIDID